MDDIIVTFLFDDYETTDFEIPAKLVISELENKIIESLSEMDFERFGNVKSIRIVHNDIELDESKTLEDYGIWDGSYLKIIEREA